MQGKEGKACQGLAIGATAACAFISRTRFARSARRRSIAISASKRNGIQAARDTTTRSTGLTAKRFCKLRKEGARNAESKSQNERMGAGRCYAAGFITSSRYRRAAGTVYATFFRYAIDATTAPTLPYGSNRVCAVSRGSEAVRSDA